MWPLFTLYTHTTTSIVSPTPHALGCCVHSRGAASVRRARPNAGLVVLLLLLELLALFLPQQHGQRGLRHPSRQQHAHARPERWVVNVHIQLSLAWAQGACRE